MITAPNWGPLSLGLLKMKAGTSEALNKLVCYVVKFTTNEINYLPFVLSLSNGLFSVYLKDS